MKNLLFILVLAFSVFAFSACDSKDKGSQQDTNSSAKARNEVNVTPLELSDKGDKFEIKHSLGTAELVKSPSKVVVFDLGTLDTFEELGLSDKVVGTAVKTLPAYLQSFKSKQSVGSVNELDFEAINEIKPELIIISGRQSKFYDKLSQIAPTIFVGINNADFLNSFENKTLTIAKLYDKEDEARAKIEAIKADINSAKQGVDSSKTGLIILTNANRMSVFGPASRFGIIHDVLGIKPVDTNIKVGTHGNSINAEYILEKNPDYLFVVDRNIIVGNQEKAQDTLNNPIIAKTKAAQTGKIIYLNPEYWYLSGGGLKSFKTMSEEVFNSIQ